jgi:hypothetical protein
MLSGAKHLLGELPARSIAEILRCAQSL